MPAAMIDRQPKRDLSSQRHTTTPSPAHQTAHTDAATTPPSPTTTAGSTDDPSAPNSTPRSPDPARSDRHARPTTKRTTPRERTHQPRCIQEPHLARRSRKHARKGLD